jgi:site-specific recombinase XerD
VQWRPFLGPLSANSRRTAMLVVNALFSYLVEAGYLAGNPLALMRRRNHQNLTPNGTIERYFDQDQWRVLLETVDDLPQNTERHRQHYERTRFLVALLYLMGPRVNEVASHAMGSFMNTRGRWWWEVTGKGNRTGRVPVNTDMIRALQRYRLFWGLTALPNPGETTPLIMSLKGTASISDNMVYRIIKELVNKAAAKLETIDPHSAATLRKASTHWFRHTSISHQADAGIGLGFLQRNARHAKLETTGLYLHAEEEDWHNAMESHRLRD